MSPTIKCFENPMELRKIKCQRILTSTKVAEEETFGYELFVSKIPPDSNEDELMPFFETIGPVHTFRLMMKYDQRFNRGHAYVTYIYESDAKDAVSYLNGKEIREGHPLSVALSFNNCRIFIGGIPVNKAKDEVWHELQKHRVPNIVDVIMYRSYKNRNMNRGFVFVEFPSHKFAAKMRLKLKGLRLWNQEVVVDWSVPQTVVNKEKMAKKNSEARVLELAKPRNHFTEPGYRKYQMLKNNPDFPISSGGPSNPDQHRIFSSTPVNVKNCQRPSSYVPTQNCLCSLSLSPVGFQSPPNHYTPPEDELLLDEGKGDPIFNFNFPAVYHYQQSVGNIQEIEDFTGSAFNTRDTYTSDNGSKYLVSAIKNILVGEDETGYFDIMNNANICSPRDYFWKFQEDQLKY